MRKGCVNMKKNKKVYAKYIRIIKHGIEEELEWAFYNDWDYGDTLECGCCPCCGCTCDYDDDGDGDDESEDDE